MTIDSENIEVDIDMQHSRQALSSPIRPIDSGFGGLDDIHRKQIDRSSALFHPLSSPTGVRDQQFRRFNKSSTKGASINPRNKHNKLKELRDRHRQDKLLVEREKAFGHQVSSDISRKNNLEADKMFGENYIDEVLQLEQTEETRETEYTKAATFEFDEYETYVREQEELLQQELEDCLRQEELEQQELEAMVADLQL